MMAMSQGLDMKFCSDHPFNALAILCLVFGTLLLLYNTALIVHRLTLSPLAKFPGPALAAATYWPEIYYDWWCQGKYIYEIERMHQKYGEIVRINPTELSINDPDFYKELYVTEAKRRTDGYEVFCKGIDFDGSHLLTPQHDLHRRRRKPLEPFFSPMGISRLQPLLAEVARHLEQRLLGFQGTESVVRLDHAFSAFSGDIIARICFESHDAFLDDVDFDPRWYNVIHMIVRSIPLFTALPWLVNIVGILPQAILLRAFPLGQYLMRFQEIARRHVVTAKSEAGRQNGNEERVGRTNTSLFRHIVGSDMPESERSDERLTREAMVFMGGGTASTARTLGFISFYVLDSASIRERLEDELRSPMKDYPERVPSWAELGRLPFLQALIKEGLRLSYGVMHRLPRCSPDVPIQYKDWQIPIGVPVGMSSYLMHSNSRVYPKPSEFIPGRWMGENTTVEMQRNWVPFSRGSRNCLGQNLAMAEMSLALAVLFRPGGPRMQLFETDETDVVQAHDFMIPLPKLDTRGVRVKMV